MLQMSVIVRESGRSGNHVFRLGTATARWVLEAAFAGHDTDVIRLLLDGPQAYYHVRAISIP
jgi:hypothetical protein